MKHQQAYENAETLIFSREDGTNVIGYAIIFASGIKKVRLHVKKGNLYAPIEFTMDELKNKIFSIQKYDAQFSPVEISQIIQAIDEKFSLLQPIKAIENLGWEKDSDLNITGYAGSVVLDANGNEILKDPYANLPDMSGAYDPVNIQDYISGHTKRQIIFLWSLASVVCGLLDKTIWLNLCALSSKGKTTSANLAQSSFCSAKYSTLCKTWASTELALVKSMDGLDGIPVLIDDTQLSKIKSYQKVIYELTNGKSVLRLVKVNHLSKQYSWATSVISTSENSLLDTCDKENEGVLPRLLEMEVYQGELFDNAQQANDVQQFVATHYGNIAPRFVKYILQNSHVEKMEDLYTNEVKSIRQSVTDQDTVLQRCIESIAIITLTGKIAEKALAMKFDIPGIQSLLLDLYRQNISEYREEKSSNIILTQMYPKMVAFAKEYCSNHLKDNYIVIGSKPLKSLLASLIKDTKLRPIMVKRTLRQNGLVYMPRGVFNDTFTIHGEKFRGFALIIKSEGGDSNE